MWAEFRQQRAWAFHHRSVPQAERIQGGDLGWVYLTKPTPRTPSRVVASLRFTSVGAWIGGAPDDTMYYPFQVPFGDVADLRPELDFAELVPRLAFIRRKDRYGVFLQGKSAIRLTPEDAAVIGVSADLSRRAAKRSIGP